MKLFGLVTWLGMLSASQCLGAAARSRSPLCGISLRPQALAVQQYVEKRSGHPISCELKSGLYNGHGEFGDANVIEGVPLIKLDVTRGNNEITLVHELFHLKLLVQGLNLNGFKVFLPQTARVNDITLNGSKGGEILGTELYSYLHHRLFYRDMEKMGLRPYSQMDDEIHSDMKSGTRPPLATDLPEVLALHLLPVLDEPDSTRKPIEDWFVKEGWEKQLQMAKTIHQLIQVRDPKTPQALKKTLTDGLALLFPLA
jgi:hypothetical protein